MGWMFVQIFFFHADFQGFYCENVQTGSAAGHFLTAPQTSEMEESGGNKGVRVKGNPQRRR